MRSSENNRSSRGRSGYGNRSSSNRSSNNRRNFRSSSNRRGGSGRFRRNFRPEKTIPVDKFINRIDEMEVAEVYIPSQKFKDIHINSTLKQNILGRGFEDPMPIQDKVMTKILVGQDVVGVADTGTGKTGAFLIPLIDRASKNRNYKTLIITPTRELAMQINDEFRLLSRGMGQYSVLCIGGVNIRNQIHQLKKRNHFIIGTPGRLKDLEQRGILNLSDVETVVLDEVDKMLNMGFIEDITELLSRTPDFRQTLFFSATLNKDIEKLMRKFLSIDFFKVSLKKRDTSKQVDQDIVKAGRGREKVIKLEEILNEDHVEKTLIFVNTKRHADVLAETLKNKGFNVNSLHGDKTQRKRSMAITGFKKDVINILIATDVAARGLDIPNVTHVINYDAPHNYEDYIHRIGRTGRANNIGYALTFVEDNRNSNFSR